MVFQYTNQFPIEYHNSDCQLNAPIASQVRVTGAQRGKMGVSLDRSSDWWRKWRDIFGGPITLRYNAAIKQSRRGLPERYLNTLKCGDSASFSGKFWHEMSELSISCILRTFALE